MAKSSITSTIVRSKIMKTVAVVVAVATMLTAWFVPSPSSSSPSPSSITVVDASAVVYQHPSLLSKRQQYRQEHEQNLQRSHGGWFHLKLKHRDRHGHKNLLALLGDQQKHHEETATISKTLGPRRGRRGLVDPIYSEEDLVDVDDDDDVEEDDDEDEDGDDPEDLPSDAWYSTTAATVAAATTTTSKASTVSSKSSVSRKLSPPSSSSTAQQPLPEEFATTQFRDLGPIGKTVAGVTEVVFVTAIEYIQGFMTGYIFGTLFGLPGFVTKPTNPSLPLRQTPFWPEFKKRFGRMSTRSTKWAKDWAKISAVFSGFSVLTKVVRNGQEDVWNEILSSAAAGAYFARKEGPNAMIRGALVYGGLIYMISGGMMSNRRGGRGGGSLPVEEYTESPFASLFQDGREEDRELLVPHLSLPFDRKGREQTWLLANTNKIMMSGDTGSHHNSPLALRQFSCYHQKLQQQQLFIDSFASSRISSRSTRYG